MNQLEASEVEALMRRIVEEDSRQARAILAAEYEKAMHWESADMKTLVQLCRLIVTINPEGRKREWWEAMTEIARLVGEA